MKPSVFVGSSKESLKIAYAIQECLQHDALCIPWTQGIFGLSRTTIESLVEQLQKTEFAVFVFTPDDVAQIRDQTYSQARDNVLFEFGLFTGYLGRDRTFFVMPEGMSDFRIPTDLLAVTPATFDPSSLQRNPVAALGVACNQIRSAMLAATVRKSEKHFLRSRKDLPPMNEWAPAVRAKSILLIGHNLYMVFRRKEFFEKKLAEGAEIKCLIANCNDTELISTLSRGVVENNNTGPDFAPVLKTLNDLRRPLTNKSLLELKTMDYVPTLSCQVLDPDDPAGTILVELTPNKMSVDMRPHFILSGANPDDREWYRRFLDNCREMYNGGKEWTWA